MNQFGITHAFPGICSKCFIEVAEFHGSNHESKPIITKYLPNYFGLTTILDDGTLMTITLCTDCAKDLSDKDYKNIMKSEMEGWEWELDNCLKNWTKEDKQKYKEKYRKRSIKGHIKSSLGRNQHGIG